MEVILCATRGGEASVRTQERAIELAKEQGAKIVFIFVADVDFLGMYTAPRIAGMEDEMERMGEFLLLIAKERAEQAGVEAEIMVRSGVFRKAVIQAAKDYHASLIILGQPADHALTTLEYLEENLLPAIEAETGVKAIVA